MQCRDGLGRWPLGVGCACLHANRDHDPGYTACWECSAPFVHTPIPSFWGEHATVPIQITMVGDSCTSTRRYEGTEAMRLGFSTMSTRPVVPELRAGGASDAQESCRRHVQTIRQATLGHPGVCPLPPGVASIERAWAGQEEVPGSRRPAPGLGEKLQQQGMHVHCPL